MEAARIAALALVVVAAGSPARADDVTYYDHDDLQVVPRRVTARGGITQAEAAAAVRESPTLLRCFPEKEVKVDTVVSLTVTPAGAVTKLAIRGVAKATKRCLTAAMTKLVFPARAKKSTLKLWLRVAPIGSSDNVAMTDDETARFAESLAIDGESGSSGDMDMRRRPGADLASQLAEVKDSGKAVEIGGSTGRGPKVTADGAAPLGRMTLKRKQIVSGPLAGNVVANKILSAYLPGLKRCYRQALAKDPTLRGEVAMTFTVSPAGRVTAASAAGLADLGACMQPLMESWRFATAADPTEVSLTFALVPD